MDVDIKTTKVGHTFTYPELLNYCKAVWGGVSWPGKRPGFAVVVGMGCEPHFDSHDIYLLDEYESFDMRKLVRQCGVLDEKYCISLYTVYRPHKLTNQWIGNYKNEAASRFIDEMNQEYGVELDEPMFQRHFGLSSTPILEMERPYQFMLPNIKELLSPERRQLFLKDSKIVNYLSEIEENEVSELELGEYPAIESLSFTVIELRNYIRVQEQSAHLPEHDPYDNNILLRGMKCSGSYARRSSYFGRRHS